MLSTVWTSVAALAGYAVATALGLQSDVSVLWAVASGLLAATATSCYDSLRRSDA